MVDLHSKAYDKRVLFVPDSHVASGDETKADRASAVALLDAVVKASLPEYRVVGYDFDCSYKAHWHAQANLEER